MVIGNEVKKKIADTPDGIILTIGDFNVPMQYQGALVKALNRLTNQGTLQRLSKGKYYKPRKTIFGTLKPVPEKSRRISWKRMESWSVISQETVHSHQWD